MELEAMEKVLTCMAKHVSKYTGEPLGFSLLCRQKIKSVSVGGKVEHLFTGNWDEVNCHKCLA